MSFSFVACTAKKTPQQETVTEYEQLGTQKLQQTQVLTQEDLEQTAQSANNAFNNSDPEVQKAILKAAKDLQDKQAEEGKTSKH